MLQVSPGRLRLVGGHAARLLSVREVAEQLGVCRATVYALCARGEIGNLRVSNAVRISAADLAAYLERQRRGKERP